MDFKGQSQEKAWSSDISPLPSRITDCYYFLPALCYTFQCGRENDSFWGDSCHPLLNSGEILVILLAFQSLLQSALFLFSKVYFPSLPFCSLTSSRAGISVISIHCINVHFHASYSPLIKLYTPLDARLKHLLIHSSSILILRDGEHLITSQPYSKAFRAKLLSAKPNTDFFSQPGIQVSHLVTNMYWEPIMCQEPSRCWDNCGEPEGCCPHGEQARH